MFENKKILILGLARSGYDAAKVLIGRGNTVILNDAKEEHDEERVQELKDLGVELVLGSHPDDLLDESFDYLIKNPGVPIDHKYVLKARELGISVINEVEMTYLLLPRDVVLIAITGTNGKTTTTTLIYEMIKKSGKRVFLVGNIGYPSCSILSSVKGGDIVVMEISSQQLENLDQFHPNIAIMTNLFPAHLEFFKTYDYYKSVKTRIFKNQAKEDLAILNIENGDVLEQTRDIKSTVKYFSSKNEINGCYLKDNSIYYYDEKVIDCSDIFLVGMHNYENIMASIMVVKELGLSNNVIKEVLMEFRGVSHRLEFVREVNGRLYYNDTEATNIKSTQIALSSFSKPIILILGGLERGQDFNELRDYVSHVKAIVGIGACRDRVLSFGVDMEIDTYIFEYLSDAFSKCVELSSEGDVILLSPASASWDQYKQCEDRGDEFKSYVENLKN